MKTETKLGEQVSNETPRPDLHRPYPAHSNDDQHFRCHSTD